MTGLAGRQAEVLLANIQADVLMKYAGELLGTVEAGRHLGDERDSGDRACLGPRDFFGRCAGLEHELDYDG